MSFFKKIGEAITFPYRWLRKKILYRHDLILEKKIRREIEVILSHELKTPLTSILAYSEMLLDNMDNPDKVDPKENRDAVRMIYRKSNELVRFLDNVINISMLEFNPQIFYTTSINWTNSTLNAINKFKSFYEPGPRVYIHSNIQPDIIIYGNDKLMSAVVFELLSNAYIYRRIDIDTDIRIELKREDRFAVLSVSDNGIGIKEKYLNRLFEKFFRIEKIDTARTSGMGIGLTLIKEVCEEFKGESDIQSELGTGTTFKIKFPLVSDGTSI